MEYGRITEEQIGGFARHLREEERSGGTVENYTRSVREFAAWLGGRAVEAESAWAWKGALLEQGLAPATINNKLAALSRFFRFLRWEGCAARPLRLQRRLFRAPDRELSRAEYGRLLSAARSLGRERLCLLMDAAPKGILGVSTCMPDAENYYYIAVASTRPAPEGMHEYVVPACTWAVFPGRGSMPAAMQELQKRVVSEWLPGSGYEWGQAPDLEVYLDDGLSGESSFEVWLPVAKR